MKLFGERFPVRGVQGLALHPLFHISFRRACGAACHKALPWISLNN